MDINLTKRRIVSFIAITCIALGGILATSTSAEAAALPPANASTPSPNIAVPGHYTYAVSGASYVSNYVNTSQLLGRCYATGGTCTIAAGKSSTRTIGLSLGATRGEVAAGLSISAASTVSITVSCTSPKLASGVAWSGYPIGRYYSYKIKEYMTYAGGVQTLVSTSGTLHAFVAYASQIYCK